MEILFYEDEAQLEKILTHRSVNIGFAVLYKGRSIYGIKKILKCEVQESVSFFILIKHLFKINTIICEYANLVPRFFAFILNKKIESHIFGNIEHRDIVRFNSLSKDSSRIHRFLVPAYADIFFIYGKKNPTRDIQDILLSRGLRVIFLPRLDLDKLRPNIKENNSGWVLFIGQPWRELNFHDRAELQEALLSALNNAFKKYYYCIHPRQKILPENIYAVIDGWKGLVEKIKKDGAPICAISINSSLLFELEEAGVATICIGSRVDGNYQYPCKNDAVRNMMRELATLTERSY